MKKVAIASSLAVTLMLTGCSSNHHEEKNKVSTFFDNVILTHSEKEANDNKEAVKTATIYDDNGKVLEQYESKNINIEKSNKNGRVTLNVDGKKVDAFNSKVVIKNNEASKYDTEKSKKANNRVKHNSSHHNKSEKQLINKLQKSNNVKVRETDSNLNH